MNAIRSSLCPLKVGGAGIHYALGFLLLIAAHGVAFSGRAADAKVTMEEMRGQQLASELRSAPPEEETVMKGKLSIRESSGTSREIAFSLQIQVMTNRWSVTYEPSLTNTPAWPSFSVVHEKGQPNQYLERSQSGEASWKPLDHTSITKAFAGSDFSVFDLGLEFLHWPQQRWLRDEMRKSRSCHVLESTDPSSQGGGYRRVLSWLDVETGGLLLAEAYDAQGKLVKEFTVNSMKKVGQRWQVQQMEIRNLPNRSRTRLDFELR